MIGVASIFIGILTAFIIYIVVSKLVNDVEWALWLKYDIFNRAPFNCVKCFNFWSNLIYSLAFIINGFFYYGISVLTIGILITLSLIYEGK